ncbi:tyrosine-type recombinase/integrase [Hyphomicrobium zavarzinii]|uniref:tyrosine-type recombinase/integrase n=1 Tax=Hyphomicrobium zavarzinii TaxID=48292 RepID=UPI000375B0E1|nr:integrase arm-type DNA-binding domain-containing protein [Hyphomicrobium zavarzinii]
MPLTDTAIRNAKPRSEPFKISDGGGLHLLVQPNGSRLWRLAYRFASKQKTLSLGSYPTVSLAKARDVRESAKRLLADGIDPSAQKRRDKLAARAAGDATFKALALEYLDNRRHTLTPLYADQLLRRLEADVFPYLGTRPITEIDAPELLDVLRRIEKRGVLEQARRLRQSIGQVFRYAMITGRAKHDPSTALKGALKPKGRQKHHTPMPRDELPGFLRGLDAYDGDPRTALALRLIVLTMVRTTELRAARWEEFEHLDGREPLWRIPAERMKARFEHLVPLSNQAVAALAELRALPGAKTNGFLFPSPSREGCMSNNTMLFALYRMGWHGRATVHGFRGVSSTILNEMGFPPDWIERQLAHDERDDVRGAYNSAQYLPGRRQMLQRWADWLAEVKASGKVIVLAREAAA